MIDRAKARKAIQFALGAVVITSSFAGVTEAPHIKNTWQALNKSNPECAEITPAASPYDIIAVFSLDSSGENISPNQKEAIISQTASAFIEHHPSKIVIVGNISGIEERSIIKAIKSQVKSMSQGKDYIVKSDIDFINHAVTFAEGVSDLSQLMEINEWTTVLGISSVYYANRITLFGQYYGINMTVLQAECAENGELPLNTEITHDIIVGEKLGIIYSAIDPNWLIPSNFKRLITDIKTDNW